MTNKKKWIKKVVYAVLFIAMIGAFIYLSEKYKSNADDPVRVITDYYDLKLDKDKYTVITGGGFINLIQHGRNIIIVGSKTSSWSKEFVKQLDIAFSELEIDKVYYYDINNDKSQKNSNYYKIKELLNGSLTTTDGSKSNLLAPSLYIIIDGEVKYYNVDTVAMKNTIQVEDYWKEEKKLEFRKEVKEAITKYYLNN
jgi:hypothetical protein